MSNFAIYCLSKEKRPACDEQFTSAPPLGNIIQAVMYSDDPTGTPIIAANLTPLEIGSQNDQVLLLSDESPGVTLTPLAPAPPAIPRRISVPEAGNYHYDIDITYELSGDGIDDDTVIRFGPTIDGVPQFDPLAPSDIDSLPQVYGDANVLLSHSYHVSGNLNLGAGQGVGIFYWSSLSAPPDTLNLDFARLRIFRTGDRT